MDELRVIEDFPEYGVAKDGSIYNLATQNIRRASYTREGAVKITLFRDNRPYTRSLPKIVAEAWLYNDFNPEIFDTPIHLDNDLSHNHVDNLAWRPRWFAVKYQRQYWNEEYRYAKTMVEDVRTGDTYESMMGVCQRYGYLYLDVLRSCTKGDEVYPTWRQFRFVD